MVVFDGDSRTRLSNIAYPLQAMQLDTVRTKGYDSRDIGVSGQAVTDMVADAATQLAGLAVTGRNIVVLFGGVNDAHNGANATTIYNSIVQYCGIARGLGYQVIVCTEIDAQDAQSNAAGWHTTIRPALNALINANWPTFADRRADLGADARLQDATNTTYYTADLLHPTEAGYAVIAGIVAGEIVAL